MSLRNLFVATAVLGIIFGLAYLLVPEPVMRVFGTHSDAAGYLAARFFGGACLGLGVMAWLARERGEDSEKALVPGFTIVFVLGTLLSIYGTLNGLFSSVGWVVVLIFLVYAVAFAYFEFAPSAKRR